MLQFETLPASLAGLLWVFRPCLTAPSFATFAALAAGLVAQPGRRTVCGMLLGAGLSRVWHHSRAHWFFTRARWSPDALGLALLALVLQRLSADAPVVLAVDDTLFRRSGRKVAGAGWQHDGAADRPGKNKTSWGTCFVVVGVLVEVPFAKRPVCLPVLARLCPPKAAASKQSIAGELVALVAAAHRDRTVHVVADAWYAGAAGAPGATRGATRERDWPTPVTLTSRLRVNAVLHSIAVPMAGKPGRPRRIGARLGTPTDLAAAARWRPATVRRYGRDDTVQVAEYRCLWYGVYRSRTVRVLLVRDRADRAETGYRLALVSTDLTSPADELVARYAARWAIEVAFEDAKQLTGVGQARNRTLRAVERTVPFGLLTQSLVVVWYTLHGHHPEVTAERRRHAPWYRTKTEPAYLDMIVTLRRTLIAARFRGGKARTPTPEETLAVHAAWAQAAA
jgi:DDE superfamily endonuclease